MEARDKETGKEFKVRGILTPTADAYAIEEVDLFFDESDQVELLYREDYWTRLLHQYAGMAMQGISEKYFKEYRDYCAGFGDMDEDEAKGAMEDFANAMADVCYYFAHALVEKMKEEK